MEFSERLQGLRKQKGITQEEMAAALYVSRTAVSKWESGRGYPNIESLKAIAKFFDITVDDLLSGNEILTIAEEDAKQKQSYMRDMLFGLFDLSFALLLFLPFFAEKTNGVAKAISLLGLTQISQYLKIGYLIIVAATILLGVLTLAFQNCEQKFWIQNKSKISLFLNVITTVIFVISLQPYAAIFCFTYLIIKFLLIKKA